MGVIVAAAIPLASSCGEDEDDDVYALPAGLDEAGIVQLVKDANATFAAAKKITVTENGTGTEEGQTVTYKEETQLDKTGKKYLATEYINGKLLEFRYVEEGKRYDYYWEVESLADLNQNKGEKFYFLETLSTETINNYFGATDDYYLYGLDDAYYTWVWKVSGNALVGTQSYKSNGDAYSETRVYEITLDTDKRFKSVKITSTYIEDGKTEVYTSTETISYDANPSFPSEFNKADFKPESSSYESSASLRAKRAAITGIGSTHRAMQP